MLKGWEVAQLGICVGEFLISTFPSRHSLSEMWQVFLACFCHSLAQWRAWDLPMRRCIIVDSRLRWWYSSAKARSDLFFWVCSSILITSLPQIIRVPFPMGLCPVASLAAWTHSTLYEQLCISLDTSTGTLLTWSLWMEQGEGRDFIHVTWYNLSHV